MFNLINTGRLKWPRALRTISDYFKIWKTVQKAGKKSATFFWPGSEQAG